MAAIRPMELKSLIEKELKREVHVRLKKNVVDFTHWLRRHVEAYLPYDRLVSRSEALTEMKDEKPKKDWKAKRNGGVKVAVVSMGDSKTKATKTAKK